MTDYAPLPLREPVRSLVWIRGQTASGARIGGSRRPRPDRRRGPQSRSAASDRFGEATPYVCCASRSSRWWSPTPPAPSRSGVSSAAGGPARTRSAQWSLLAAAHRSRTTATSSTRLAAELPTPLRRGRVRPLGLDRYGFRLRVEGEDGDHDVRLPFAPVDDVHGSEPGHPDADGMPVRQRPARPPILSRDSRAGYRGGVTAAEPMLPVAAIARCSIEIVIVLAVTFGFSARHRATQSDRIRAARARRSARGTQSAPVTASTSSISASTWLSSRSWWRGEHSAFTCCGEVDRTRPDRSGAIPAGGPICSAGSAWRR